IRTSAPARIVNVSSAGQHAIDFDDVMLTRGYDGVRAYCQSKLAQILFTVELAQRLADTGVTVTAPHPPTYMNPTILSHIPRYRGNVKEGWRHSRKVHESKRRVEGRPGSSQGGPARLRSPSMRSGARGVPVNPPGRAGGPWRSAGAAKT